MSEHAVGLPLHLSQVGLGGFGDMRRQSEREVLHPLVQRSGKQIAQVRELGDAQVPQQGICTVERGARGLQPGCPHHLLRGARPGPAFRHADVLVVDEPLEADGSLAQRRLSFAFRCEDHAANQPQWQGVDRSTGLDAAQDHFPGAAGRLRKPAHHVRSGCRRQLIERGVGASCH